MLLNVELGIAGVSTYGALTLQIGPGAGGNIGADLAAKSDPDGYTLLLGTSGPLAINIVHVPYKGAGAKVG